MGACLWLAPVSIFASSDVIAGECRFETAIEVARDWVRSEDVVVVNSNAPYDMLCASVLASQLKCPILLTYKDFVDNNTLNEIIRLKTKSVYIIGGVDVVSDDVEDCISKNNINTIRISGDDRYETSLEVAKFINSTKSISEVVVVNGEYSVADAVSIGTVAGSKSMPVILSKQDEIGQAKSWIYENKISKSYIIGGSECISESLESQLPNTDRVWGFDRYETNAKVIDRFFNNTRLDTLYYCKGDYIEQSDEVIDGMLVTPLAVKNNAPVVLLGEELSKSQKQVLETKNINKLVQVGNGVNEEAKKELYKIKDSYIPPIIPEIPSIPDPPTVPEEPDPPETPEPPIDPDPPITPEEPNDTQPPKYEGNYTIDENKEIITINFDEDIEADLEDIKSKIKIEIKIKADESDEANDDTIKYLKLNKYDNVTIENNKLIIQLSDGLLGLKNSIIIDSNTIKDKHENYIQEDLQITGIKGLNKKVAFVTNEGQLAKSLKDSTIDIIKLEENITLSLVNTMNLRVEKDIIIDGSNGEENYTMKSLHSPYCQISIMSNGVTIKNINFEDIRIEIAGREDINLNNINMTNLKSKTPSVIIDHSIVEGSDIIIDNEETGILVKTNDLIKRRSNLIINGVIYNQLGPSIIVENKIEDTNLNKITIDELLENLYTKTVEKNDINTKSYEIYMWNMI